MKLRLIPGWKRSHRLTSSRAAALLMFFSFLQSDALPMLHGKLPPNPLWWVTLLLGLAIIVFRVLSQPGVLDDPKAPTQ